MSFKVMIDDNFHYMDERAFLGREFATLAEAIAAAQKIVDENLTSAYQPGITADALMASYVMFGEDPFIVTAEVSGVVFSARDYARKRVAEMCTAKKKWW